MVEKEAGSPLALPYSKSSLLMMPKLRLKFLLHREPVGISQMLIIATSYLHR